MSVIIKDTGGERFRLSNKRLSELYDSGAVYRYVEITDLTKALTADYYHRFVCCTRPAAPFKRGMRNEIYPVWLSPKSKSLWIGCRLFKERAVRLILKIAKVKL